MATLINFTPTPVILTSPGATPPKEVLEVAGIRVARFSLRVLSAKITGTFAFDAILEGNMTQGSLGWTALATFPSVTAAPMSVTATVDMPMRYLRWNVTTFNGCASAVFQLDGLGWF